MIRLLPLVVLLSFVAVGCKKSSSNDGGAGDWPKRVDSAEGDATVANKVGTLVAGKSVIVDLERPARPGEGGMWSCWGVPPETYALGRAVCTSDATIATEITVANADKTCGNSVDFGTVKATAPITFDGCASYDVYAYEFEPALTVKVGE